MASEFSSNIREIAAELKLMDKKLAAGVRKAIRTTVLEGGKKTTEAIKASADRQGMEKASAATSMKVSFSVRSGGAKIATNKNRAPYARALEKGSQGAGGAYDRHPVFGRKVWVNQPTRPFFYGTAAGQEKIDEAILIEAVNIAARAAGFTGT